MTHAAFTGLAPVERRLCKAVGSLQYDAQPAGARTYAHGAVLVHADAAFRRRKGLRGGRLGQGLLGERGHTHAQQPADAPATHCTRAPRRRKPRIRAGRHCDTSFRLHGTEKCPTMLGGSAASASNGASSSIVRGASGKPGRCRRRRPTPPLPRAPPGRPPLPDEQIPRACCDTSSSAAASAPAAADAPPVAVAASPPRLGYSTTVVTIHTALPPMPAAMSATATSSAHKPSEPAPPRAGPAAAAPRPRAPRPPLGALPLPPPPSLPVSALRRHGAQPGHAARHGSCSAAPEHALGPTHPPTLLPARDAFLSASRAGPCAPHSARLRQPGRRGPLLLPGPVHCGQQLQAWRAHQPRDHALACAEDTAGGKGEPPPPSLEQPPLGVGCFSGKMALRVMLCRSLAAVPHWAPATSGEGGLHDEWPWPPPLAAAPRTYVPRDTLRLAPPLGRVLASLLSPDSSG
jgi:hypothetical protein